MTYPTQVDFDVEEDPFETPTEAEDRKRKQERRRTGRAPRKAQDSSVPDLLRMEEQNRIKKHHIASKKRLSMDAKKGVGVLSPAANLRLSPVTDVLEEKARKKRTLFNLKQIAKASSSCSKSKPQLKVLERQSIHSFPDLVPKKKVSLFSTSKKGKETSAPPPPAFKASKQKGPRISDVPKTSKRELAPRCRSTPSAACDKEESASVSRRQTPKATKKSASNRAGFSAENPVMLEDEEEEEQDMPDLFEECHPAIHLAGIWLGDCNCIQHMPSKVLLKRDRIQLYLTPYLHEDFQLDSELQKILYCLSGATPIIAFQLKKRLGRWYHHYDINASFSSKIWVTLFGFYGQNMTDVENRLKSYQDRFGNKLIQRFSSEQVKRFVADHKPNYKQSPRKIRFRSMKARCRRVRESTLFTYNEKSRGAVHIKIGDLDCLDKGEMLNDTIIDFYIRYLQNDVLSEEKKSRYFFFNSFFYTRYISANRDFNSVKRWTDSVDLFALDYWIIPVHDALHWTLAVVCFPGLEAGEEDEDRFPCMLYFDSLGGSGVNVHDVLHQYLKQARAAESRRPGLALTAAALLGKNRFKCIDVKVPRQTNSCDCGVYLLHFAEKFIQRGIRLVNPHKPKWFPVAEIEKKRQHIRLLLCRLAIGADKQEEWGTEDEQSDTDLSSTEEDEEHVMDLVDEKGDSEPKTSFRDLCNASAFRSICSPSRKDEEMSSLGVELEPANVMEQPEPLSERNPVSQQSNRMSILDEPPMQLLESCQPRERHQNEHKQNLPIGTQPLQPFVAEADAEAAAALTASSMSGTTVLGGHRRLPKQTHDPDTPADNDRGYNSETESVVDLTS